MFPSSCGGLWLNHACHELLVFWRLHILCLHTLQSLIGGRCSSCLCVFLFFSKCHDSSSFWPEDLPAPGGFLLGRKNKNQLGHIWLHSPTVSTPRDLPQWPLLLIIWTERVYWVDSGGHISAFNIPAAVRRCALQSELGCSACRCCAVRGAGGWQTGAPLRTEQSELLHTLWGRMQQGEININRFLYTIHPEIMSDYHLGRAGNKSRPSRAQKITLFDSMQNC